MTVASGGDFRPDIEGMRAVAVGLVLLYHAGIAPLAGGYIGVDVFFVISGFLISRMLIAEVERTGRVSLAGFYARRVKRLLPAAVLVLAVTSILVWLFIHELDREVFGGDIAAAAAYVVNVRLARRSVDYLAEDVGLSPVQHFWSLAVEEQFYIAWPLLLLLVAWWCRRSRWSVRATLAAVLACAAIPSLAWSISAGARSAAFFVITTRFWELAVGAALAIAEPRLARLPRRLAAAISWAGLAAVIAAALVIDEGVAWPGYAALWPTLATAAVLGAGAAVGEAGPVIALGRRPLVWLGGLSYSVYLWHWPLLVAAAAQWGELSASAALAVIAVSIALAWITHTLVENPVRYARRMARPWFALGIGANLSLAGVGVGLLLVWFGGPPKGALAENRPKPPGAAVLDAEPWGDPDGRPVDRVEWFVPDPAEAPEDVPIPYAEGCQVVTSSADVPTCVYAHEDADIEVALVGDSKAVQWFPALHAIAVARGWKLVVYGKSACPFADAVIELKDGGPYDTCTEWNRKVLGRLLADPVDYVITSQGRGQALVDGEVVGRVEGAAEMVRGLQRRWKTLMRAGIQVIVLSDTLYPDKQVYRCVAENRDQLSACAFARRQAEKGAIAAQRAAVARTPGVHWIDLNDAICPGEICPAIIGNALIYRQGSHITATYVETLAPRLEAALAAIIR